MIEIRIINRYLLVIVKGPAHPPQRRYNNAGYIQVYKSIEKKNRRSSQGINIEDRTSSIVSIQPSGKMRRLNQIRSSSSRPFSTFYSS